MDDTALIVDNLNIYYLPYHSTRIRDLFSGKNTGLKAIHAIKDLSFTVKKGEVVGIVGRNGSGKTTLLRSIAGIFSPDSGRIDLCSNRVSLMSLGVGFDPELSGRENIILSGMMLGFSKKEITGKMNSIIEFSELGIFIDYPVRTYSSGMYSKLAFSITSFLEAEIILIDEVLSVGDIAFQKKSRRKMRELISRRDHTVLMVSHDLGMLENVCDKVLWLNDGRFKSYGETKAVLEDYMKYMYIFDGGDNKNKEEKKGVYIYNNDPEMWHKITETIPQINVLVDGVIDEKTDHVDERIVATGDTAEAAKELQNRFGPEKSILPLRDWVFEILKDDNIDIRPVRVRLEACTLCQLSCLDCYMRKEDSGTVGKGYLKLEDFISFIEDNPFVRQIELSNSGEVFLNPDLTEILRISAERDIKITMGNGVNLNNATDEQLEAVVKYEVSYITVSIDGVSQEVYSHYRRNGDIEKVLTNIRKINSFKKKYRTNSPYMNWQFIEFEHNRHEIGKAQKQAEELDMHFYLKRDWGGYVPEDGISRGSEKETGAEESREEEYMKPGTEKIEVYDYCSQMLFEPQINWDGRLLGCCRVFKEDWGVNVFETHSLVKALKMDSYRKALLYHLNKQVKTSGKTPCDSCSDNNKYMF